MFLVWSLCEYMILLYRF